MCSPDTSNQMPSNGFEVFKGNVRRLLKVRCSKRKLSVLIDFNVYQMCLKQITMFNHF